MQLVGEWIVRSRGMRLTVTHVNSHFHSSGITVVWIWTGRPQSLFLCLPVSIPSKPGSFSIPNFWCPTVGSTFIVFPVLLPTANLFDTLHSRSLKVMQGKRLRFFWIVFVIICKQSTIGILAGELCTDDAVNLVLI